MFVLNDAEVSVADGTTLLDALREELGCRSVKDGCSPQGQCGCCTVWVDGAPRVSCVTPVRRVAGRRVTTLEGLSVDRRARWAAAFARHGASQCGFCTPGIVLRLSALEERAASPPTRGDVEGALRAHLCRCTGWQSIVEAACEVVGPSGPPTASAASGPDGLRSAWRAEIEGAALQSPGLDAVLGDGGFADDTAPPGALVQLGADGVAAPSMRAARRGRGRVQGRNSTAPLSHPLEPPPGDWAVTLRTTWVEPAYVEPDASWSRPGGPAASPLANGGAFGGKRHSPVAARARALADEAGQAARVLWRREDVVRLGPKRPPLAVALRTDGSGVVRVGRSAGSPDLGPSRTRLESWYPEIELEEVSVDGPLVSSDVRGAVWAEVLAARAVLGATPGPTGAGRAEVSVPGAGRARVTLEPAGEGRERLEVDVWAGAPVCAVTLRSYALGAVHQGLGLVRSEGIALDATGAPVDLTIRSFGILAAKDMPEVVVRVHEEEGWPVNGSDAVLAATLAAAWMAEGRPDRWPTRRDTHRAHSRHVARSGGREEPL